VNKAVYVPAGELLRATEIARGPWDPNAQHGGAPAALLVRAFERLERARSDEMLLARVTYEFLRPLPIGELAVAARMMKAGRRSQLLEGTISTPDGTALVRARALGVGRSQAPAPLGNLPAIAGPDGARPSDFRRTEAMFGTDAVEIRFVAGAFNEPGPATAWFRMRHPLVAGEEPSPMQRLAAAGDFGNGISAALPWEEYVFINPDLTLYVERLPAGEWVCLQSQTRLAQGGIAIAQSVLFDQRGHIGHALQALVVARR